MKGKNSIIRDIQLLFEIGTLRHVGRVWHQFLGPYTANCADHILRVAWIALTIAKREKISDHTKILKMALAHDIAETRTGDVHYLSRQYTKRNEENAMSDILKDTILEHEMVELSKEYEERKTIESKIVKDADNLDVEFELAELRWMGHSLGSVWTKNREKLVYPHLYTKTAKELWKGIAKANPHDWHLLSPRNRFRGGDWKRK